MMELRSLEDHSHARITVTVSYAKKHLIKGFAEAGAFHGPFQRVLSFFFRSQSNCSDLELLQVKWVAGLKMEFLAPSFCRLPVQSKFITGQNEREETTQDTIVTKRAVFASYEINYLTYITATSGIFGLAMAHCEG
jgi:hypothetical protein